MDFILLHGQLRFTVKGTKKTIAKGAYAVHTAVESELLQYYLNNILK